MNTVSTMGSQLRQARKKQFPGDTLADFAIRIGVSRATLQKMEQGDLSVSMANYYRAAEVLNLTDAFHKLFEMPVSMFDD